VSSYTNSQFDNRTDDDARTADETAVRSMYEDAPYPGLGADLKDLDPMFRHIADDLPERTPLRFLDVGCGTGHIVVGVAKRHPDWMAHGIDLSQASLDVAAELSSMHNAPVNLARGSYLEPLPFEGGPFDVITALGTVHHTADPMQAMCALRNEMSDDGWMLLGLYGWRCDAGKFDIKSALDLLEPDLSNHAARFELYDALMRHREGRIIHRIATTSLADIYYGTRTWLRNKRRRARKESWSPPWTDHYTAPTPPWIDHFCHPCERAYEVPDVRALVEGSGFRVVHNLRQGIEHPQLIPPEWRERYDSLDAWDKWRMSEVLANGGGSFALWLKKA